ncbi:MAG: biliverdin-producing heme oxygenase [Ottowia sp.]|nr:biliverdin-producing heme oxygenase [Ottowia sp.]
MMRIAENLLNRFISLITPTPSNATTQSISNGITHRMYEASRDIHKQNQRSEYTQRLAKGILPETSYVQHLTDQHLIYQTLENEMKKQCKAPDMDSVYIENLCRAPHIYKDIQAFNPANSTPSAPAKCYAEHLERCATTNPRLLLAHAYILYGGALTGGFVIKKWVEKSFPGKAEFYNFDLFLQDPDMSKEAWKKRIDAIPLTRQEENLMCKEALIVFQLIEKMQQAALTRAL